MRRSRNVGALVIALVVAVTASACEPLPPRVVFRAVPTASGPDTHPGDGVCANAEGECSLQAAIEEAGTARRASILTSGTHPAFSATVTGDVELLGDRPQGAEGAVDLRVAEGAVLRIERTGLRSLAVDGAVLAGRVALGQGPSGTPAPPALVVGPSATVILAESDVVAWAQDGIVNDGRLELHHVTVWAPTVAAGSGAAAITTGPAGRTNLVATHLLGEGGPGMVDACAGTPPTSGGWNLVYDHTCGIDGPGDVQGVGVATGPYDSDLLMDAIPIGSAGCQEGPSDTYGLVEAIDGDEDGVAACDIGSVEYGAGIRD